MRKLYRYQIDDGRVPDPFLRKYAWFVRADRSTRRRWAGLGRGACLLGRHDFRCFETEWPNRLTSVRTITHLSVNRFGEFIWVDVEADGFLYNMVRSIVGSTVLRRSAAGTGRRSRCGRRASDAMDRRLEAGPTAPPEGLFLVNVQRDLRTNRRFLLSSPPTAGPLPPTRTRTSTFELEVTPLARGRKCDRDRPGQQEHLLTGQLGPCGGAGNPMDVDLRVSGGGFRSEDTEVMIDSLCGGSGYRRRQTRLGPPHPTTVSV